MTNIIEIINKEGNTISAFKSLTDFAAFLPLSTHRLRRLVKGRHILTEEEYEMILKETFKPSIPGAKQGEKRTPPLPPQGK